MRIAVIDKEKCLAPKECNYICQKVCPRVRAGDKDTVMVGEDGKPIISENLCIGCGICVKKCPGEAITIVNLPEALEKDAIHRYTKNGFELFRTVIPNFGKIVGILGQNGIGKTTILSILAGLLYPNLGDPERKPDRKEIINFFKGSEAQKYFELLFNNEIKVSYKLQYVDAIPKKYKGKVRDLLQKVCEKKEEFDKIIELLELGNILDRDISSISGGELQRVAIAASMLKDANVYFFDEPSSYLDIRQRLKIAKIISELNSEERSINVIEHDLIVLDYLCDLIHILYGKPAVYGIISHPISVRNGINTYLSGYLKDENVRFRDYQLKFEVKPPAMAKSELLLTKWGELKKSLGDFSLKVNPGEVYRGDIVGCIGENGIGKTTFIKMLAGELKPDSGNLDKEIKISYKPQYIKPESDATVGEILSELVGNIYSDEYRLTIINPLQLKDLLNHKINSLSGGELQRVAIAVCLSREADLYLLDEPSAYLDVEQRVRLAKVIREIIKKREVSALIIDHDLLFIDYISDKLLVFKGIPSISGETFGPVDMRTGMNEFLKSLGITMRRDAQSNRPRINKLGSVKDREQKEKGEYYYA